VSQSGAGAGRREVAWRLFATEFDDATYSYSEGDEERAPNYVITPTGARVNRVFVVGVLTEVEPVTDEVVRARVVDPTGAFVVYAGQYQPDALAFLERAETPSFVAVTGKARTFEPDDGDVVYTSIRPESVNEVDAATRDRWVVTTAEHTLDRVRTFADALHRVERGDDLREALLADDVDIGFAAGIPLAIEQYGTTTDYLAAVEETALDAVRVVAGQAVEVARLSLAPDEGGDADLDVEFALGGEAETASATASGAETTATAETAVSDEAATDETAVTREPATDETAATEAGDVAASADADVAEAEIRDDASEATEDDQAEPADADATAESEAGDDAGEDELFELSDEERQAVEDEYGTEFASGSDIPEAGEADIETPGPDQDAEAAAATTTDSSSADETEPTADEPAADEAPESDTTESAGETADANAAESTGATADADVVDAGDGASDDEPAAAEDADTGGLEDAEPAAFDGDLEDVVVEYMEELNDGDGADRAALVEAVTDEHGVGADDVAEAIQDALMSGRCFEPDDETLMPI